jgi:hypothetical protein
MNIGDRVEHKDMLAQNGTTLPMRGTVVGVVTQFIVRWDDAEERQALFGGGKETHTYAPEFLVDVDG